MNKRIAFLTLLTALLCVGLLTIEFRRRGLGSPLRVLHQLPGPVRIIDVVGFCVDANGRNWTLYSGDCDKLFCWDFPLVP